MASILYIFPHPDDESFGPAPVLARQRRAGHEVHLLTLTRGEATSQRHKHGYTKEEMGAVRYEEMQGVADALDLTSMRILDFPDGRLADLDPLDLEAAVAARVRDTQPDVLVTYAVHGISGHPDHLVSHALVKRVYAALRADGEAPAPRRLAFFTLKKEGAPDRPDHLTGSPDDAIDCIVPVDDADIQRGHVALDCYATYQEVIDQHNPLNHVQDGVRFEFFQEHFDPPLNDLFEKLADPAPAA